MTKLESAKAIVNADGDCTEIKGLDCPGCCLERRCPDEEKDMKAAAQNYIDEHEGEKQGPLSITELRASAEKIMGYFGPLHQYSKLTEELQELNEAICDNNYQNKVEECGDVLLMLLQFYAIDENLQGSVAKKVNRTLKLIEEAGE